MTDILSTNGVHHAVERAEPTISFGCRGCHRVGSVIGSADAIDAAMPTFEAKGWTRDARGFWWCPDCPKTPQKDEVFP